MANRKKALTLFACLLSIILLPERSWAKGSLNPLSRPAGNPPPTLEACTGTPVEIDANDPVLEGAGPCKIFRYGAISEGIVHIEITEKTFDWRVRVTAAESGSSWAASGGIGSRPSSIAAAVKAGEEIRIVVAAAAPGEGGTLTLTVREENRPAGAKAVGAAARRAKDLLGRAEKEKGSGDRTKAEGFLRAALAVLNDEPGCRQSGKAIDVYWDIGTLADDLKDYGVSRTAYYRVARFRESTLPRDDELLTRTRILLALACEATGDREGARGLYKKIIRDLEETRHPPGESYLQQARVSLASLLPPRENLPILEKAVSIYEKSPPRHPLDFLFARKKYAESLKALDRLDAARDQGEKFLEACEALFPPEHPIVEEGGVFLAEIFKAQEDLFQAKKLLEKVMATRRKKARKYDPLLMEIWVNLAKIHSALGDLPEAVSYYEKILDSEERVLPSDDIDLQRSRVALALAKAKMGDVHGALPLLEKAAPILRRTREPGDPDRLAALSDLAILLKQTGRDAEAKVLLEEALEEAERNFPPGHESLQFLRLNLAWILKGQGEYERAGKLLEKVAAVLEETKGPDDTDLQLARMNLAGNMIDRGLFDEGLALLKKAGAVWENTLPATSRELEALRLNLGEAYMLAGQRAAAQKEIRKALKGCGEFLSRVAHTGALREIGEAARRSREVLSLMLSLSRKGLFTPKECLVAAENFKALGVRIALMRRIMARKGGEKIEKMREDLAAASLRAASAKGEEIEKAIRARDGAERLLAKAVAALGEWKSPKTAADPGDIGAALPEGWAGISFVRFHSMEFPTGPDESPRKRETTAAYAAFIVDPLGKVLQVDLGPAGPIDERVEAWRNVLCRRGEREKGREIGRRLAELIWKPLERGLGEVRKVIVAPDSVLATVPLEALPVNDGFLLERYTIAYIDSLSALAVLRRNVPEGEMGLVAFGGVDFDAKPCLYREDSAPGGKDSPSAARPAAWALSPSSPRGRDEVAAVFLPGTAVESAEVASLYRRITGKKAILIQGALASKASFTAYAQRARYLHVATHGYFAGEEVKSAFGPEGEIGNAFPPAWTGNVAGLAPSLLCGLKLAGCNRKRTGLGDEGVITAEEIQALDLTGCRLAVLSACESNVGLVRSGEGIMSLQRALGVAGARGSITSLWKIDDEAARLFFTAFYRLLWKEGSSPVEALRQVELDMLHGGILPEKKGTRRGPGKPHRIDAPEDYRDPFFWAAFVYWGRIG